MEFFQDASSSQALVCGSQSEMVLLLGLFDNEKSNAAKHHNTQDSGEHKYPVPKCEKSFTPALLQLQCAYKSPGTVIQGKLPMSRSPVGLRTLHF